MLRTLKKPDENHRYRQIGTAQDGGAIVTSQRDFVHPVPVGGHVVMIFRVTGYDPDCDGSALARLEHVNTKGETSGMTLDCMGLWDGDLIVDDPSDLLEFVRE